MIRLYVLLISLSIISCGDLTDVKSARSFSDIIQDQDIQQEPLKFQMSREQNMTLVDASNNEFKLLTRVNRPKVLILLADSLCKECVQEEHIKVRQGLAAFTGCQILELVERPLFRDLKISQSDTFAINTVVETLSKRFGVAEQSRYFVVDSLANILKEGRSAEDDLSLIKGFCI
jgi:hypothetical protein